RYGGWGIDGKCWASTDVPRAMMVDQGGVLKQFLSPDECRRFTQRSVGRALAWFVPEYVAWIAFTVVAISPIALPLRLAASILSGGAVLAPAHSWATSALFGWLIPFLYWNWLIGLVIYMHHTHPSIGWIGARKDWSIYRAAVTGCIEARMPGIIDRVDNNIMR